MSEPIELDYEGVKYQTRDGRKVRVIANDLKGYRPILAIVTQSDGNEYPYSYQPDGRWGVYCAHDNDLIPRPKTHEVPVKLWLWRSSSNNSLLVSSCRVFDAIAIKEITVTFTEGEGLE